MPIGFAKVHLNGYILGTPEPQLAGNIHLVRAVVAVRRLKKPPGESDRRILEIFRVPVVALKHQQATLERNYRPGQAISLVGHIEPRPLKDHVPGEDDKPVDVVIDRFLASAGPLRATGDRPDGFEGEGLADAIVVGFVHRAPTLSTNGQGLPIARCAVAVTRSRIDPDHPTRLIDVVTRISILAFNKNATQMVKDYQPGHSIIIDGKLREHLRQSQLANQPDPIVHVMVDRFVLLSELNLAGTMFHRQPRATPVSIPMSDHHPPQGSA